MTSLYIAPWPHPQISAVMAHVLPEKHPPGYGAMVGACRGDQTRDQSDLVPACCRKGGDVTTAAKSDSGERLWPVQGLQVPNCLTRCCCGVGHDAPTSP